jgi:mRNA-degrading endonuclease RelE of RelBE toxin-antitoxin system
MTCKFVFMPRFERSVKRLKKRYRHIADDVEVGLEAITSNLEIGTVIPDDYLVHKLRLASQDMQRGKSGGFRLLHKIQEENVEIPKVYLLFIYAKAAQEDVSLVELQSLIQDMLSDDEADNDD